MALPDSAKITIGTPIVLADATDAGSGSAVLGARTDQIDLTSLASDAMRQGAKVDFSANIDLEYVVAGAFEFATAPTAGETVDLYMAWSNDAAAGDGNPGGVSGADSAYTGSSKQLQYVGSLVATVDVAPNVQIDTAISTISPRARYGTLVVHNNTSDAFAGDANEMAVRFTPLVVQIQD